ncbi:MAG: PhoH family protein [Chitinispirillia bacterium]|jgi:PhoH-like ATPase
MKNYIIDTNVLLHDARALFQFGDNNIIIPITVIEEIDNFKKDMGERGRNARHVSRIIDDLRKLGSLIKGVKLENGGNFYVKMISSRSLTMIPEDFRDNKRDAFIFAITLEIKNREKIPTILVTKDVYLRIKADALNITVSDYESDNVNIDELYAGYAVHFTKPDNIQALKNYQPINIEHNLKPNQYVVLKDENDENNIALGRYDQNQIRVVPLVQMANKIYCRIKSRNREQAFALDALLNDSIEFVTLLGKAGTGKTLLAVAASVYKTVDENVYNRILVSRPTFPLGQNIGYLPGTVEEKLTPWMYPIADNVELIMHSDNGEKHKIKNFKELVEMGILVIEPLTFIRGRSIHNQYLIVDEAQNLTPHEIKTIITRVGEGTKIILTGDPYQIDNPYIDSSSNGLSHVVEKFKDQPLTAHITLTKGERSAISELAANLL